MPSFILPKPCGLISGKRNFSKQYFHIKTVNGASARPANKWQVSSMKRASLYLLILFAFTATAQVSDSVIFGQARNKTRHRIAAIKIEGAEYSDRNVISLLSGLNEGDEIMLP